MCPNPNLGDMSKLPGDPSVVVHTNIAMGDKKLAFMKAASKSVADCLSKPEAFVVIAVLDEQDMIWGGEETPCAIITVNSLGGINYANNTKLSGELTALMSEFDVAPDRMYTNFWDIGFRENCGYNGVTFAEGARQAAAASQDDDDDDDEERKMSSRKRRRRRKRRKRKRRRSSRTPTRTPTPTLTSSPRRTSPR
jgi:phenylpyruvate tautomerase